MRLLLGLLLALVAPAQAAILNDGFEAKMPVSDWKAIAGPKDGTTSLEGTISGSGGTEGFYLDLPPLSIGDFPTTPGFITGVEVRFAILSSQPGVFVSSIAMSSYWSQIDPPFSVLFFNGESDAPSPYIEHTGDLGDVPYMAVGGFGSVINNSSRSYSNPSQPPGLPGTMRQSSYWHTYVVTTGPGGNPYIRDFDTLYIMFGNDGSGDAKIYVDAVDFRLHYADSSTVAMTGSGTMTATVQKMVPITAAMSGGGTMAATANAKRVIAANMVGSGKLSPVISRSSGGVTYHYFMPELSGSGTMTVAPLSRYAGVSAAMTGGGTMDVVAHRAHGINAGAPVAMTGKGTMAVAVGVLRPITAAMTGSGTFAAAVAARRPVAAAMSGSGTMTADMIVHRAVQAAMSGSGTLTAVIQRILGSTPVTAAMEGGGTMTASAGVLRAVAAAMVGSGTLDATVQVNTRLPAPEGRRFRVPNDALAFIVPDDFQTFEAQE